MHSLVELLLRQLWDGSVKVCAQSGVPEYDPTMRSDHCIFDMFVYGK